MTMQNQERFNARATWGGLMVAFALAFIANHIGMSDLEVVSVLGLTAGWLRSLGRI
jgi:Flp pilus assembly protein protease CpaA